MRSVVIVLAVTLLALAFTGCVQPRFTSPEYSNPYGDSVTLPERRWWGEERPAPELDVDRILFRYDF